MSIEALNYAVRVRVGDLTAKFVLGRLADRADERYSCYPSVPLLAAEAEKSPRVIQRALATLRTLGLVSDRVTMRADGSQGANRYYLHGPWDDYGGTGTPFPEIVTPKEARAARWAQAPAEGEFRAGTAAAVAEDGDEEAAAEVRRRVAEAAQAGQERLEARREKARKAAAAAHAKSQVSDISAGGDGVTSTSSPPVTCTSPPGVTPTSPLEPSVVTTNEEPSPVRPSRNGEECAREAGDETEGRTGSGSPRAGGGTSGARPGPGTPGVPTTEAEGEDQGQDVPAVRGAAARPVPSGAPAGRRSPGVELLLAIGQERPEYLLTGRTLSDQGLMVTGMLDAGWSPELVRQIVAGRPLPPAGEIRASVGAIVAARLRDAVSSGPPPPPGQHPFGAGSLNGNDHGHSLDHGAGSSGRPGSPGRPWDTPTPTAPTYGQHLTRVMSECEGQDGACGRPVRPGYDLCTGCLDLPWCECGAARIDPGRGEERCPDCGAAAEALGAALHAPHTAR
ncbi:helix-turn-helix domain-containing protein [Streptomyces sp. NBRC 109706]|uniref:helix-turn-helix domain-containing protein n=1 Tax=Streptomyces sp. NBRC 109706 TaxID=1550035 RepID=UPI0007820A12|nr:helix-turn-helix domain-containing protein [Streptomyces sp. NBRC 109706]